MVVLGVSTAITTIFTCTPIPKAWIPTLDGHCIDIKGYLVSAAVLNMFFDVVVFALPLPFLQHIKRAFLTTHSSFCAVADHVQSPADRGLYWQVLLRAVQC